MDQYFWHVVHMDAQSLISWSYRSSVPIVVRSSSRGYDWRAAQPSAAEDLGMLVSLLSLIWDSVIDVLKPPMPLEWGQQRVPEHAPWLKVDPAPESLPDLAELPEFEVPGWLGDAWVHMNRRARVKGAVTVYMEGVRTEERHPSLALVAYVAAVEAVSLMLFHEERCEACPNHINIGEKFHATLKLAVGEEAAEALRPVYGSRSKTVHTGRLHGYEISPGAFPFSSFLTPSEASFQWQILRGMKTAARKLLILAVRDQLPKRSHYRRNVPSIQAGEGS
jgi:hypothetical protein